MAKNLITDLDKFLYTFYGFEDDLMVRDVVISAVKNCNISNDQLCNMILDNHLNNSGDIYGLLHVIIQHLKI